MGTRGCGVVWVLAPLAPQGGEGTQIWEIGFLGEMSIWEIGF